MKILYGVQGTGNGHLSRARAMNRYFSQRGVRVDYLFSGRSQEKYFDMEAFGEFLIREGLTFATANGKVNYFKTLFTNNPATFIRDVRQLDVDSYDVIVNDFEPVTAWAGKLRKKTVINIGHQQAFDYPIPMRDSNLASRLVMKFFAPGTVRIGLHWHHFGYPILPPIIEKEQEECAVIPNKILVYLPFENPAQVAGFFQRYPAFEFFIYSPYHNANRDEQNIHQRKVSLAGFRQDMLSASGVICNAGFETPSECLQLDKRVLVKPVHKQMEQVSNALALDQLRLGQTMDKLDGEKVARWLEKDERQVKVSYPNVAEALADWILKGDWSDDSKQLLCDSLWRQTTFSGPIPPWESAAEKPVIAD